MLVVSVFVVWSPTSALAQTLDESAIRRQLAGYAAARERGDGTAQASYYTVNADELRTRTRRMVTTRAEIAKDLHLPPRPTRKFRFEVESIRFITPEVAVVETQFFGSALTPNGHATYVMTKRGDSWLIEAGRITGYPEAVPAAVVTPALEAVWKKRQGSIHANDVAGWLALTASEFVSVSSAGEVQTRAEIRQTGVPPADTSISILESVRAFGEDAGVTHYLDVGAAGGTWTVVSSQSSRLAPR
jgi:hypothetical protein